MKTDLHFLMPKSAAHDRSITDKIMGDLKKSRRCAVGNSESVLKITFNSFRRCRREKEKSQIGHLGTKSGFFDCGRRAETR